MPEAPLIPPLPASRPQAPLPRPPVTTRLRSQLEAFLVLRRNALELWGKGAYEEWVLPGSFLGRRQILLNQPDAIRHVLVTNADNYGRNLGTRRVLQPVLGEGLFLAEGEAWRHQRRTIAPALAPRTLPVLARHIVTATESAEAALDGLLHRPLELLPRLQHLALTIAGRSMFSLEMAEHGEALRRLVLLYARRHAQPGLFDLVLPAHLPTPSDLGRAGFRKDWLRLMDRMIAARRAQPAAEGQPRDLFDLLSEARDPQTGAGFDTAQLRDEVATLILAGHETTAVTLFWACYIAAHLPEEQERVAQEAGSVDLSADMAAAALRLLPRTRAFIDETLRLYPPAFLIVREARGPDQVAGIDVPVGTVVSVSPWVLHRHRRLWDDPDRFDPARFLPKEDGGMEPPDRYAYLPFGAGPRICVGAQFALSEAVLVLARLLRRYRLRFAGTGEVVPRGFVTTQPDRPVRFLLERRRGAGSA